MEEINLLLEVEDDLIEDQDMGRKESQQNNPEVDIAEDEGSKVNVQTRKTRSGVSSSQKAGSRRDGDS